MIIITINSINRHRVAVVLLEREDLKREVTWIAKIILIIKSKLRTKLMTD